MSNITWLIKHCLEEKDFTMQRFCNNKSYCSIPPSIWDKSKGCGYRSNELIEIKEANIMNIPAIMYDSIKYFLCKRKNSIKFKK